MNNISAIIVVKKKPPHFFETLDSIDDFVSEIIIGSIDLDPQYRKKIEKKQHIKIIELDSSIPFADLIKEDLKKYASGNYILYLDPDEIFPEKVKDFLLRHLQDYDYYYFPRKNIIFNKWIVHSRWWPDNQLRLFRKDSLVWPKKLHPIPQPKGSGYTFVPEEENAIYHYNYDNIDQYIEKSIRYAKSEAKELLKEGELYTLQSALKQSLSEFMSRFFAHEGYKDGMHGFVLATLQMFYYFLVFFYYWEEKKYFDQQAKELVLNSRYFFTRAFKESNYWLIKQKIVRGITALKLKLINKFLQND